MLQNVDVLLTVVNSCWRSGCSFLCLCRMPDLKTAQHTHACVFFYPSSSSSSSCGTHLSPVWSWYVMMGYQIWGAFIGTPGLCIDFCKHTLIHLSRHKSKEGLKPCSIPVLILRDPGLIKLTCDTGIQQHTEKIGLQGVFNKLLFVFNDLSNSFVFLQLWACPSSPICCTERQTDPTKTQLVYILPVFLFYKAFTWIWKSPKL